MATYVISDIHGKYEEFKRMIKMINLKDDDQLFVIGDMIDRGPQSIKLVEHIMNTPNIHAILGNHEENLIYAIKTYGLTGSFATQMIQGTDCYTTYKQLRKVRYKSPETALNIVRFLNSLPTHHFTTINGRQFLLVHAGIRSSVIEENTQDDMVWIREEFFNNPEIFPFTVVFGHTPTAYFGERGKIWKKEDRIGIDCGASFMGGRLGCLRLDDLTEFYVD